MSNGPRPPINLDLDLLRTFVAVADVKTFAAAAARVQRTQSAVSQQMQRLEQLVGKELFARQGRNKYLTDHGVQLLNYARKILRFNDEACHSLINDHLQGTLVVGATDDSADSILPQLLGRFTALSPKLAIDVRMQRNADIQLMLLDNEVDLAVSTGCEPSLPSTLLRRSPTVWFCATDYDFTPGVPIELVVLDEPSAFRSLATAALDAAGLPWRLAYVASTLPALRAALKAGLGISARPIEMMSSSLRVLGEADGLPRLADTEYSLCLAPQCRNPLAVTLFDALREGDDGGAATAADEGWVK
ncbi:LysR substrate-binding domain-containing protein [Edwardsiella piscicida]|uniref:LysR substrate-binding domain-containing protein n=1 Tax=Edwardsiella piscicida TaxID=1263550 RepID=UPI00054CB35D|nr:LysR substrate-binding domain-containing protein [Edwardsiella piscicida]ELM3657111.1 LysR family transcriptional regulator [Edwardsiella piscicida]ELM3735413.1 LysR family transcriptional regulator [Edwardsiella piscicida]UCQ36873.1 LysR family transcriptional regulator [Edwardsiella piscicida]WGS76024.1 LysR substrate-binding domain-containing protein [Edwardsiella piscicida]WGS79414.1 LysR substrate-binding domain-containing protein [Edwardsiella piscicida]